MKQWTFGQRLAAGFAVVVALALAMGSVSILALRRVVDAKDRVIRDDAPKVADSESLRASVERKGGANRAYLLTRDERFLTISNEAHDQMAKVIDRIRPSLTTEEGKRGLDTIVRLLHEYQQALEDVVALRKTEAAIESIGRAFESRVVPKRDEVDAAIRDFIAGQVRRLEVSRAASSEQASSATTLVIGMSIAAMLLAILIALRLGRTLGREIGLAVGQVQSSTAELEAAANQQATGAKEQVTAMNEISTTITELLATSRQISESAQRVAQIATQTAGSARTGNTTVEKAHESIDGIRRQVDQIVNHMLELGKKSQEIGTVVDVVSELAEQTNILAINATIEAAGAGDAGKRFAVVADEIRKLADRVGGSTKQIRTLIDDVRGAVNTTVMATETGSKAVDAGSRQFTEVASAFRQIGGLVTTTTDAAREIELSTKQQTTAVEQVNIAIGSVAQASKETEASSAQTLATASQLGNLSRELLRLVERAQQGHGSRSV